MKFIKIATISFLAGNAVVADINSEECEKAGDDLQPCVLNYVANDTAKTSELEKLMFNAIVCFGEAEADYEACMMPVLNFAANGCPDGVAAMKEACGFTSFKFEDFALDLAEELKSTAYAYGLRGSTIEEE